MQPYLEALGTRHTQCAINRVQESSFIAYKHLWILNGRRCGETETNVECDAPKKVRLNRMSKGIYVPAQLRLDDIPVVQPDGNSETPDRRQRERSKTIVNCMSA